MTMVKCPYCEGDGQVKDWADDNYGNTTSWWETCECCEGEGELSEKEYELAKTTYLKPNRILREEIDKEGS